MPEHAALPLDSPRWRELSTRQGEGAEWVAAVLRGLNDGSLDSTAFDEMWPHLCSEGSTYDAAFAAAPHLTHLAWQQPSQVSRTYLIVLGLIATDADEMPEDLLEPYRESTDVALDLALKALTDCPLDYEFRYLLAAVAAFRGATRLADVLQNLDTIEQPCPRCDEAVYADELQQVIQAEHGEGQHGSAAG